MAKKTESGEGKNIWQFVDKTAKDVSNLPAWVKGGNSERTECSTSDSQDTTANTTRKLQA